MSDHKIKPKRTTTSGAAGVPTTSNLEAGEIAINLADKKLFVRDTSSNILELTTRTIDSLDNTTISSPATGEVLTYNAGSSKWENSGSTAAVWETTEHIAAVGQQAFSAVYTVGSLDVFLNGIRLDASDYTAYSGTLIILDTGCAAGDTVYISSYSISAGGLPSQAGNTGKYLTTDGTTATWASVAADTNNYVDSLAFSTSTGVLTVGRSGSLGDLTVDLDGKYLPLTGGVVSGTTTFNYGINVTGTIDMYQDADITSNPNTKGLRLRESLGDWLLSLGISGVTNTGFAIRDVALGTYPFVIRETTGNVGIGTTNPYNKLHVYGTARLGNTMVGDAAASNVPSAPLHIKSSGVNAKMRIEDSDSSNLAFDFLVNHGSGFSIIETIGGDAGDDTRLHIAETTGNVGIGTVSPSSKLEVSSNTRDVLTLTNTSNAASVGIEFNDHTGGTQKGYFYGNHSDSTSGTPAAGYAFHFTSSEATTNVVLENGGSFIGDSLEVSAINTGTQSADGSRDVFLFNDGGIGNAQNGAFHSKLRILGGSDQSRDLQLYQVDSGYATIDSSWNLNQLHIGSNFTKVKFNQDVDVNGTIDLDNKLEIGGVDTGNPENAVTDTLRVSGYGIQGRRGSLYITNSNSTGALVFGIGGAHNANVKMTINSSGNVTATGTITAYYSDERLKTNLGNISSPLDKILKLNGFNYIENKLANSFGYDSTSIQIGVSAQEVQKVLPAAVSIAPFDRGEKGLSKSGEDYLTVDYAKMVPLLIEAIKELKEEVDSLKGARDE